MSSNKPEESCRCAYCGTEFVPVQRSQRFCSDTNHRYLHHARIRPRGRRRDSVRISEQVDIEVVHVGGAAARPSGPSPSQ